MTEFPETSHVHKLRYLQVYYLRKHLGFISINILLYNNMVENNTQVIKAEINIFFTLYNINCKELDLNNYFTYSSVI